MIAYNDEYILVFFSEEKELFNKNVKYVYKFYDQNDNTLLHTDETTLPYKKYKLTRGRVYKIYQYKYFRTTVNDSWKIRQQKFYSNIVNKNSDYDNEYIEINLLYPHVSDINILYNNQNIVFIWDSINTSKVKVKIYGLQDEGYIIYDEYINDYPYVVLNSNIFLDDYEYIIEIIGENNTSSITSHKIPFKVIDPLKTSNNKMKVIYDDGVYEKEPFEITKSKTTNERFIKLLSYDKMDQMSSISTFYNNNELKYIMDKDIEFNQMIDEGSYFIRQYITQSLSIITDELFYLDFDLLSIFIPENNILTIYNKSDFKYTYQYLFVGPCLLVDKLLSENMIMHLIMNNKLYQTISDIKVNEKISMMYFINLKKILLNRSLRIYEYETNSYNSITDNKAIENNNIYYNNIYLKDKRLSEGLTTNTIMNIQLKEKNLKKLEENRKIKELMKYKTTINTKAVPLSDNTEYEDDPGNDIFTSKYPR